MKQLGGGVEVLEPMASESPERLIFDERRSRSGDDHLAAVGECGDPRAAVDVDPDVALRGWRRRAGVQAHSHPDRPGLERLLARARRRDSPRGRREGDEERVTLGVDLHTAVGREGVAQHAAMLGQRLGIQRRAPPV